MGSSPTERPLRPHHRVDLHDAPSPSPSPLSVYTKPTTKTKRTLSDHKTTLNESSLPDKDAKEEYAPTFRREDFVRGRWAIELNDWGRHCVPNGWMVCCLPCVAVAQIAARLGVDSFGAALAKQLVFNVLVWGLVALELVYCYRYISSVFGHGTERTSTPPIVIFSACLVVAVVSFYWARSLATLRAQVRTRFRIEGSTADDQCAMAWCTPCALAQMATQVRSYTPGSCDVRAPEELPAYIP